MSENSAAQMPQTPNEIREKIEEREAPQEQALQPDYEGIALLLDRLRNANTENRGFKAQALKLLEILNAMLHNLTNYREGLIEQVRAVGEWAQFGIDLRNTPFKGEKR